MASGADAGWLQPEARWVSVVAADGPTEFDAWLKALQAERSTHAQSLLCHGGVLFRDTPARRADQADDHERAALAELTEHVASGIHLLARRMEAESIMEAEGQEELFRREAIDAYASRGHSGDVVRVLPPWVRWAYWMLLVLLAAGTVYLVVGRVDEYSVGPAMVRMSGRSDISTHVAGKVVGFNLMGIRYRQEVCQRWLREERDLDYVLEHLAEANFDPEFFRTYERELRAMAQGVQA